MTIGNKVVVLDEDMEGVVVGFFEAGVRIETTDGFEFKTTLLCEKELKIQKFIKL